jgi:hypothetical protein
MVQLLIPFSGIQFEFTNGLVEPTLVASSRYLRTCEPPVKPGTVNEAVIDWFPDDRETMCGAPGVSARILNILVTGVAAKYTPFPSWLAVMLQIPALTAVTVPESLTRQTVVSAEE